MPLQPGFNRMLHDYAEAMQIDGAKTVLDPWLRDRGGRPWCGA
jgi:hypothetical protein